MIRKEKICFSRTQAAGTLFYTKISRISLVEAIRTSIRVMKKGQVKVQLKTGGSGDGGKLWIPFDKSIQHCQLPTSYQARD